MAKGKSQKQKADEAYLRVWGQTDIEDQIAQEAAGSPITTQAVSGTIEVISVVPDACPSCGRGIQRGIANPFTHMLKRDGGPWRIQCGHCAHTLWCTEAVWLAIKRANAARFGEADVKVPKKFRQHRERGTE